MKISKLLLAAGAAVLLSSAASAATLDEVRERGELRCVISTGIAGFAYTDASGNWQGFDVDFCRATAAAVLGDPNKIRFVSDRSSCCRA